MTLTIFTSDRFADHLMPPGHPERIERAEVMQVVASEFRRRGGAVEEPRPASEEDLLRIHDPDYVGLIGETAGRAVALDPDTFTSPDSYDVARLAAGAVIAAVDHVLDAPQRRALALVRPPGHHAERGRAMGFCLFNNIAIGAAHARARGLGRVAIVDYDVHHGNGTQRSFYDDPAVLFISSHQYPYYPGTGAADAVGAGAGAGFTVNFPIEAGATDADYECVYGAAAALLEQFRPELVLISAGFDSRLGDPLGQFTLTDPDFADLTDTLVEIARQHAGGRIVSVLEGGYSLEGLPRAVAAHLGRLSS